MKNEIFARGFGNQDPILAYKKEGYEMFDNMIEKIRETTATLLLNTTIELRQPQQPQRPTVMTEAKISDPVKKPEPVQKQQTVVNTEKKVGRNDLCPCGSGKKYKSCCGK